MKQIFKKIAIATFILAIANVVYAQSWSINSNTDYAANFTSIDAAMASEEVVAGDTLYIGAGCVINSAQTITKAVTVIGTGWGYIDSPVERSTINGDLTISADGAKIIGLHITGNVYIQYSNIIIESCKIGNYISVNLNSTLSNVKILKCLISNINGINSFYGNYITNWTIKNCIITSGSRGCIKYLYNATIENNVLINTSTENDYESGFVVYSQFCTIKNNIMIQTNAGVEGGMFYGSSSCVIANNVLSCSADYKSSFPGNTFLGSNDIATVFSCTGSVESGEYYSLKEESPAIGAGEGGADCGIMEGAYKFVPYGRPRNIPVIKKAVVPSTSTDGKVKVSLKIENQNE